MYRRKGYADVWRDYAEAGWTPTPLPRGKKYPPQPGVTGDTAERYVPTSRDFRRWASEFPCGNVMITMREDVVGIDLDVYHGGDETLDKLVRAHGELPDTWESSSREDGSGIGLYRVPAGTRLRGVAGPGIEIIQAHHRYAVVYPSIHPEGRRYEWWFGTGAADIPKFYALPDLPRAWLKALTGKPKAAGDGTPYSGDVDTWLSELPGGWTPRGARRVLREAEHTFGDGSSRYDTMVTATAALVAMGAARRPGIGAAIEELDNAYFSAVDGERDAEREFWRAVEGAVKKFGGRKPRLPLGSVTFGGRS